ncbi:MAG TPA: hypothetical protein VFF65_08215 [Phycisphaerales bacterium]|nr:hypothetical protein [Phycisphaerales bacterium]
MRPPNASVRLLSRAALLMIAAGSGACVTEVVPAGPSQGPANRPVGSGSVPHVTATPTPPGATTTTRLAASIKPLGTVPYDGLTLPLVTPDGRWIVTQTGPLPPWEAVLAEPGATPLPANAIAAFEVVDGGLRRAPWNTPPAPPNPGDPTLSLATAGLLLGRSAGDGWVIVEQPNDDGSRWIGRLALQSGTVEWLVQGEDVNAQALLLRSGTLVFARRSRTQAESELVIRPAGAPKQGEPASDATVERAVRREGWYFCQPVTTPDQSIIAVLAISAQSSELLAYSATQVDAQGVPMLIAREPLGPMGAAAAFQAVTSVEASPPEIDSPLRSTILVVNADRRRVALWDPARASMNFLPVSVGAAARVHSPVASGLVMASPRGVDFWSGSGLPARLVAGSFIPRTATGRAGTRLILLSPAPESTLPELRVIGVEMVAPNP